MSEEPEVVQEERRLRRTVGLAALVWVGVYVVQAASAADQVVHPAPYALGLAVWIAGSLLSLRPLVQRLDRERERRDAALVAASVPLAGLLDLVSLRVDALGAVGNWSTGGVLVPLVALVLRRSALAAALSGATLVAVQVAVFEGAPGRVPVNDVAALWSLVPLWVGGAWLVRNHLRRTRERGLGLRARRASADTDRVVREREQALRARGRQELQAEVLPLLQRVAALPDTAEIPEEDRHAAGHAAAGIRDALLARTLMDADLRERVRLARARGMRVVLHNALRDGPAVESLRRLVVRLIDLPGLAALSVRTFSDPYEATLVLRFDEGFVGGELDQVRSELGEGLRGWASLSFHDLDGVVMVELAGQRPN